LPPSQLRTQLDKKAAATVCMRHYHLRCELAILQLRYQEFSNIASDIAARIQNTQEQLDNMTCNIDQVYCDALGAIMSQSSCNDTLAADNPAADGEFQTYCMHIFMNSLSNSADI
jgi:hypothetical protein